MSALSITKLPNRWGGDKPLCANRCMGTDGTRVSAYYVSVAEWPFPGADGGRPGFYCDKCAGELRKMWNAALAGTHADAEPVRTCDCGCGTPVMGQRRSVRGHQRPKVYGVNAEKARRVALDAHARRKAAA